MSILGIELLTSLFKISLHTWHFYWMIWGKIISLWNKYIEVMLIGSVLNNRLSTAQSLKIESWSTHFTVTKSYFISIEIQNQTLWLLLEFFPEPTDLYNILSKFLCFEFVFFFLIIIPLIRSIVVLLKELKDWLTNWYIDYQRCKYRSEYLSTFYIFFCNFLFFKNLFIQHNYV